MRRAAWFTVLAAAAALCALHSRAQEITHVGWVEEFDKCSIPEWRENEKTKKGKPLDPKVDRYRLLYPGEGLRCRGSGKLEIRIYDTLHTLTPTSDWYNVVREEPRVNPNEYKKVDEKGPPSERYAAREDQKAIEAFGRVLGRARGVGTPIFSPADDSVVRADKLVIRWTPLARSVPVRLRLLDEDGIELCCKDTADGGAGRFESEQLRRVLLEFRNAEREGRLRLIFAHEGTSDPQVAFSVLSAENEKALEVDLARCDTRKGLMPYVCRIYAFTQRRMWNEATEEYDAALQLEPRSRDLLLASIFAHRHIGDTVAVKRLTTQLPSGTRIPE